ncbi:predicted protein [Lichtheimia corymbifera JMRC:FSU:9682]|uniref:Uncharacterized protein n=1 Tax=Lichtheimia corymbifera JMRC:FSU:9682 TaxID=1263082 RepID=A0A068RXR3_9FUNG|nr:predicted protein [Lichtheimia corymbifera JMRC:FSU:9682]
MTESYCLCLAVQCDIPLAFHHYLFQESDFETFVNNCNCSMHFPSLSSISTILALENLGPWIYSREAAHCHQDQGYAPHPLHSIGIRFELQHAMETRQSWLKTSQQ